MAEVVMFLLADRIDKRRESRMYNRKIRDATNPFDIPNERFLYLFKLSKEATLDLLNEIGPYIKGGERSTFIPLITKLVATLQFYGFGANLKDIGSAYVCRLSKSMVCRSILQVTQAIDEYLAEKYIKFPTTSEARLKTQQRFYHNTGFPFVIGAIDCTHIKIKRPNKGTPLDLFKNSKGFFSKNVQIICDSDLNILACYAKFGGSVDKTTIWEGCAVRKYMESLYQTNENCWLIGDSVYPLEPWLITPLTKIQTEQEQKFNDCHAKALSCIHKLIFTLKKTFKCLCVEHGLLLRPEYAGAVINCCCTLHNFRQKYNLNTPNVLLNDIKINQVFRTVCKKTKKQNIRNEIISKYFH